MEKKIRITNEYYYKLFLLHRNNPELTFKNNGYEYLKAEVIERNKTAIENIEKLLKKTIKGFVKFNNFVPRKDGTIDIRCQYRWDVFFTGVGYFKLDCFRFFEEEI